MVCGDGVLIRPLLICVAGKSFGDPSTELWLMYLDEDESLGGEISGGWEWDRDDVLVFVSSAAQFSLLSVSSGLCRLVSSRLQSPFSSWRATKCCHPT